MLLNRREMLSTSALLATGFLVGCNQNAQTVLRLGLVPWKANEPFFLAREQGYFAAGLQIVEYPGTPEIHRSFQNQAIEAATVTLDEALRLAQLQPDIRVIMAMSSSHGADALLGRVEIASLPELKGKRIGVELNSSGTFILHRVLEFASLSLNDITVVPITPANSLSSFKDGAVDALIAYEPFASQLKKAGARVLFDSTQIPGEIVDVLIVRQKTLEEQAPALINLLQGWFRAVAISQANTKGSDGRGKPKSSAPGVLNEPHRMELLDHSRNLDLLGTAGGALSGTVRKLCASMKKYELLNEMIDPALLLDATILKQATP